MAESDVSFTVLGPLTVSQAGRPIAIGGRKEQLVLAQLLARANAVVSVDALVEVRRF
jgi:DNA-binding SARP family transcriptional activator